MRIYCWACTASYAAFLPYATHPGRASPGRYSPITVTASTMFATPRERQLRPRKSPLGIAPSPCPRRRPAVASKLALLWPTVSPSRTFPARTSACPRHGPPHHRRRLYRSLDGLLGCPSSQLDALHYFSTINAPVSMLSAHNRFLMITFDAFMQRCRRRSIRNRLTTMTIAGRPRAIGIVLAHGNCDKTYLQECLYLLPGTHRIYLSCCTACILERAFLW